MPSLKLTVEYIGTAYKGWQAQPGQPTIQGVLRDVLKMLLREQVDVSGAARTDAGVHAHGQVACVHLGGPVDRDRLHRSLRAVLPGDIGVRRIETVEEGFHPRHSATGRVYRYRIIEGDYLSPFERGFAAFCPGLLDVEAMDEAARALLGEHDFTSFCASGDVSTSRVKRIRTSRVERDPARPGLVTYTVEADSFLQYMVRNIAGTLIEIGRGRRNPGDIPRLLAARDRRLAGPTAPARGLFLMEVLY
ncbi:MAG: tRNA pseudouridine(38-40) synthase TruA [Acidobacteriota bacterium]